MTLPLHTTAHGAGGLGQLITGCPSPFPVLLSRGARRAGGGSHSAADPKGAGPHDETRPLCRAYEDRLPFDVTIIGR